YSISLFFFTLTIHILYSLFFFFHTYGDHRDLHSFATRRSSDLSGSCRSPEPCRPDSTPGNPARRIRGQTSARRHPRSPRRVRRADRKSTRLNSSHVEISYAVFCLKKKKK